MSWKTALVCVSLCLHASLAIGQAPAGANIPVRITRQPDFGIPFQLAQNVGSPAEVHLYVSSAQGKNWELYQKQPPTANGFQFRAPRDGEYWFAVRTVDRAEQPLGSQTWQPELKVVVDTVAPKIRLRLMVDERGSAVADWVAEDPNLAAHSFRLECRDANGKWLPIDVARPAKDDWRQEYAGRAPCPVASGISELVVRAEVSDRAGNPTVVHERVSLKSAIPRRNRPAERTTQPSQESRFQTDDPAQSVDSSSRATRSPDPLGRPGWLHNEDPSINTTALDAFSDRQPLSRFESARRDASGAQPMSGIEPPVAKRFSPSTGASRRSPPARILSSPHFELDYELFDIGPDGVKRIELWVTRDHGETWTLYGPDHDRQSPMQVRVDEEGLYGFRLVVQPLRSSVPRAPRRGDPADMIVGIDWNRPLARLRRAQFDDNQRQSITIEWQAEDALLRELPIRLSYGPSREGPWTPIARELPNSGVYQWQPGQPFSQPVFVQLEVSDLAGNVTTDVSTSPISLGEPRGLIRDIRALRENTSFRPQLQR